MRKYRKLQVFNIMFWVAMTAVYFHFTMAALPGIFGDATGWVFAALLLKPICFACSAITVWLDVRTLAEEASCITSNLLTPMEINRMVDEALKPKP